MSELLSSIENQTIKNFEHVFIDGNSQDDTLKIIKKYESKNRSFYPISLYSQVPNGISAAMNYGLSKASGDYVWFLHSDDRLSNNKIVELVSEKLSNPNQDWLIGNCGVIDEKSNLISNFVNPKLHFKNISKYNSIPHPSTLVSVDLIRKVGGFNEKLKYAMDYDLWLRLIKFSNPTFIDIQLAEFREHSKSLSTTNQLPVHLEDFKVRISHSRAIDEQIYFFIRYLILYTFIKLPLLKKMYSLLKSSIKKNK